MAQCAAMEGAFTGIERLNLLSALLPDVELKFVLFNRGKALRSIVAPMSLMIGAPSCPCLVEVRAGLQIICRSRDGSEQSPRSWKWGLSAIDRPIRIILRRMMDQWVRKIYGRTNLMFVVGEALSANRKNLPRGSKAALRQPTPIATRSL